MKEEPPNDSGAADQPEQRVRLAPNGDVEVLRSGIERPIVLNLPATVVGIVEQEIAFARESPHPAVLLARSFRAWELRANSGPKARDDFRTCFDECYCVPMLLFWVLEHFSDADFPLNEDQKIDLSLQSFHEADCSRGCYVGKLKSTVNADSLDYCWYFMVRLLAIEADLTMRNRGSAMTAKHRKLIHSHYRLLRLDIDAFHEMGWITIASPKDEIEKRLFEMATDNPSLTPSVRRILSGWGEFDSCAERLYRIIRCNPMRGRGRRKEPAFRSDRDQKGDAIVRLVQKQHRDMFKIRCLERVMTPETGDDAAWHHPLEYVEHRAAGKHVLFLDPSVAAFEEEDFSRAQRFAFDLMERMARSGFRHWLHTEPEIHLHFIQKWLKGCGDSRSLKSLTDVLQEYLRLRRGMRVAGLRDFLAFPDKPEPSEVSQEIEYWQEVWVLKERAAAEVRVYMAGKWNERVDAMHWMQASADRKFVVIGDAGVFQGYSFDFGCTSRETSLIVHHHYAIPDYQWWWRSLNLYRAMSFAAYEVGRKAGWGDFQSAVLPIKDNQRLLDAFDSGPLRQESQLLLCQFHVTTSGGYADMVIFTAKGDRQDEDASVQPSDVDADAPLLGISG
jgi:hypothetical protein